MQLGKFDSDRDSALHYLTSAEFSNESFGDVTEYGLHVARISNTWEEVKPENTEMTSVLSDWFEQNPEVTDGFEFRHSLVGHFIVMENSNGSVTVVQFETRAALESQYVALETTYNEWDSQDED